MKLSQDPAILCRHCGALCCRLGGAVATENEVWAIIDAGYENHFLRISRDVFITDWQNGGICPYLEGNTCSIYEVRPFRCRAFPVHQDSNGKVYLSLCPVAPSLSKEEIESAANILSDTPSSFREAAGSFLEPNAQILQRRIARYPRRRIRGTRER